MSANIIAANWRISKQFVVYNLCSKEDIENAADEYGMDAILFT
jgi:hypothetical protein